MALAPFCVEARGQPLRWTAGVLGGSGQAASRHVWVCVLGAEGRVKGGNLHKNEGHQAGHHTVGTLATCQVRSHQSQRSVEPGGNRDGDPCPDPEPQPSPAGLQPPPAPLSLLPV